MASVVADNDIRSKVLLSENPDEAIACDGECSDGIFKISQMILQSYVSSLNVHHALLIFFIFIVLMLQ